MPTAAALVLTLLLRNYDASTPEGRAGLERAKAWEKGVFLREAEAAQVRSRRRRGKKGRERALLSLSVYYP